MAKTTSDLLTNVKRRGQLPDDGGTLSDSDILAFASDELSNVVAPRLMAVHEWHYAFSYTQTVTSSRSYRINSRTAGNTIISVEYYDGTNYRFIKLVHPLRLSSQSSCDESYSIYGNNIILSDSCPTSGTIRIRALLRPSSLVTTGCYTISTVSTVDDPSATLGTIEDCSALTLDQLVDIVFSTSPYELIGMGSITPQDPNIVLFSPVAGSPSVTLIAQQLTTVSGVGRLCPAETSDRIMLPDELHDYLAQRVAIRCMEARGMTQDMQNHLKKLADLETAFDRMVSPRSKGEFKAIVPENAFLGRIF